ncbi:hypothetical protein [Zeaxanthinibacter enoshimensis]
MKTTIFQFLSQLSSSISIEFVSFLAILGYIAAVILVILFR